MNLKTLGNYGLIYGLAALCFVSTCSPEIKRRQAIEAEKLMISKNSAHYNKHEVEVYRPFGGKENFYMKMKWDKNQILSDRDKSDIVRLSRDPGKDVKEFFAP